MTNQYRGEISAELDGRVWTLCLTLGALAGLEKHFAVTGLAQLAERLASKALSATDMTAILAAGLAGGGHDLALEDVADMGHRQGITGFATIVSELLQATFAIPSESASVTGMVNER